jgi:zona occludens toxin
MLTLLTGSPGSGKTLFAIDNIIKIANNEAPEFKNIKNVYTNISGFKFDKFEGNNVNFLRLYFDSFYDHLKKLFAIYCENDGEDNLDDLLQEYCKQNNILDTYFIIDEAHQYFDNQDKVKNWWFTYHRHLNHEILLITQNKSLINTIYRNIPEIFIKAQPRSKAISQNVLRFFLYTEYRMTQKFATTEITVNKSYFDLYKSGNKSSQKRVGVKYIIYFFIMVFVLLFFFGFLVYKMYFSSPDIKEDIKPVPQTSIKSNPIPVPQTSIKSNDLDLSTLKYMNLICSLKYNYCLYNKQKINLEFYLKMKHLKKFQEISISRMIDDFYSLDVFVTDDFYSIYNKQGVNNEKNSFNGASPSQLSIF